MKYDHNEIEARWRAWWHEHDTFRTPSDRSKPKYYVLDMFPYPSGSGLHVGHPKGYVATDVVARARRMMGYNVMRPMGWDSFGLPAERQAVREAKHPREITKRNIATFKSQLAALGLSYDWSRELATSDPAYYKWTQWIFLQLHQEGLAYKASVAVNWCPALGTVLANEEVVDGRYVETGDIVERRLMSQWMLRITKYAESLLAGLETLDWPEGIKAMQREWIGRSEGARITFAIDGSADGEAEPGLSFDVFTTRPDTLFGCTYVVLAPEHPLVEAITTPEQAEAVAAYVQAATNKSERDRTMAAADAPKTGVFTGAHARHPITGEALQIWIADYVLARYGTGAVFACPAHDERDHAFATSFGLGIVEVVAGGADVQAEAFTGDGPHVNSDFLDGLNIAEAKRAIVQWLEGRDVGEGTVQYRLRDWLFSRQRYWGEPFPVIELEDGTTRALSEADLPITLPEIDEYMPTKDGEPPLARAADWVATTDPETGAPARRETNTMPQWAGSCWYYLRFINPDRGDVAWDRDDEAYWMPVDLYVGGAEHAVLHLLYSRFWHHVLHDLGLVSCREPFQRLFNQGMVHATSYREQRWADAAGDLVDEAKVVRATADGGDAETATHADTGAPLQPRLGPYHYPHDVEERDGVFVVKASGVPCVTSLDKMSKSRYNVENPDDLCQQYGADALRLYLINSGLVKAEEQRFTDAGVKDMVRRALLPWYNSFKFLQTYAEIDHWKADTHLARPDNITDQWILSRLQSLKASVAREMAEYKLYNVVPALFEFIEDLTNWYIRLNRSRFWTEGMNDDKHAAYQTLYTTLSELTICMAPFAPFLSEHIYQALGVFAGDTATRHRSVHLCHYPDASETLIQPILEQAVSRMQNIILLGRQKRNQVKIKTKIPMARLTIIHEDQALLDEIGRLESYIESELNVKSIAYSTEEGKYINLYARPNLPVLGKRLGKELNRYRQLIQDLGARELNQLQEDGSLTLEDETFSTDDILVFREAKEGTEALSNRFISIDMDCELNDDLIDEGLAREVVNRIQKTRKDIGLNVTDRITVSYSTSDKLAAAIEKHSDYIARETLCNTFVAAEADEHSFDVEGNELKLDIEKVE